MSQIAWVFDLNKCNGCPTCVENCWTLWLSESADEKEQFWCVVLTMPGLGYPKGWEKMGGGFDSKGNLVFGKIPSDGELHDWVEYDWKVNGELNVELIDGKPVVLKKKPKWTFNWEEDVGGGDWPNSWHFYLPKFCNNCSKPACLAACDIGAIKKTENGVVLIDEEKCNGCKKCISACPYKIPNYNKKLNIVQKCIACFPRLEKGVAPACARACPARAVHFGFLEDKNSSVYKLVKKWKVALPLHPEFNTEPNVYYIPPLSSPKFDKDGRLTNEERIPIDYLKSLFGAEVERALKTLKEEREKMRRGEDSELIRTLIGFKWPDDFFG
ncbi:MAG: 4Fe-4S dicluster domain-containing protein, partial [Archaeoglobaceae archaeon]|nr:4Fe-4S dicluster domain-containing protein [Archaeoglobaceae archaeon]MDW8117642.1 4Fe-4S dicluster domain-containing protein [Archaeoglobaceae archaeon]